MNTSVCKQFFGKLNKESYLGIKLVRVLGWAMAKELGWVKAKESVLCLEWRLQNVNCETHSISSHPSKYGWNNLLGESLGARVVVKDGWTVGLKVGASANITRNSDTKSVSNTKHTSSRDLANKMLTWKFIKKCLLNCRAQGWTEC
jgi:hypothetical protein